MHTPHIDYDLIACPYCDTLQKRPELHQGERLECTVCHSTLVRYAPNLERAFYFALTSVLLFIMANALPFISITLAGDHSTISIFSSVKALYHSGLHFLAFLELMFIIVLPLWYLLAILYLIMSFHFSLAPQFSRRILHYLHLMAPWNMLEVYLAGVIVTLVKISQLATVQFDHGFWLFCALIVCSTLVNCSFNLHDTLFKVYRHG